MTFLLILLILLYLENKNKLKQCLHLKNKTHNIFKHPQEAKNAKKVFKVSDKKGTNFHLVIKKLITNH